MARVLYAEDYQWVAFTGFMTQIICWALHEFMERELGMDPSITTTIDLQKNATTKDNPLKSFEINSRYEAVLYIVSNDMVVCT